MSLNSRLCASDRLSLLEGANLSSSQGTFSWFSYLNSIISFYILPHPAALHFSDSGSQGGRGYRARRGQGKLLRKHWPRELRIQGQGFTSCPSQTGDTELKRAVCCKGDIFSTLMCSKMWAASEARPLCINSSILFKAPPCAWQLRVYLPMPPFQKHMPSL